MALLTKGAGERIVKDQQKKLNKLQEEQKKKAAKLLEIKNNSIKGAYKKIVLDAFIKEFSTNYGHEFDYNSLVNSIVFKYEEKDGQIIPSFTIDENHVIFKSDASERNVAFNENSSEDFISNENIITGDNIDRYLFNNNEEYDAYENGDILYSDLDELDGNFVPIIKDGDRYGIFNQINKRLGYKPRSSSFNDAKKSAISIWNKAKYKYGL